MAPSRTETETQAQPVIRVAGEAPKGPSDYKEAFNGGPSNFKKDVELRGSDKQPPAKYPNYLPVWDNEKGQQYAI